MYRQGDVLIVPVEEIPEDAQPVAPTTGGKVILAEGMVTGHLHALSDTWVVLYRDGKTAAWLEVTEPSPLAHEEHDTIIIPPGKYSVIRQREYHSGEARRVQD